MRKEKNYEYSKDEREFIDSTRNQRVRQFVGAIADIKNSKLKAQDIKQQIKSNEQKIRGIPNRLGELGLSNAQVDALIDFKFPPSKAYLQRFFEGQSHINPETVFELLQDRYALAHANAILNKIYATRVTKESIEQLEFNLDRIEKQIHEDKPTADDDDNPQMKSYEIGMDLAGISDVDADYEDKEGNIGIKTLERKDEELARELQFQVESKDQDGHEKEVEKLNKMEAGADIVLEKKRFDYNVGLSKSSPLYKKKKSQMAYKDYYK